MWKKMNGKNNTEYNNFEQMLDKMFEEKGKIRNGKHRI